VPVATFTVAVLDPPIATEAVAAPAKVAVMPVTDVPYSSVAALVRVTVPVSAPSASTEIVDVPLAPGAIYSEAGFGTKEKPAMTFRSIDSVVVFPLLSVPVILIV
jgi:hypothetical protein